MIRRALQALARVAGLVGRGIRAAGALVARVLPSSRRGRLALVGVLVVAAAAIWGANYYRENVPTQRADDYRKAAERAADRMTDAMDGVYATFDQYLDVSTAPRSYFRNAKDIDELRRRVVPLLDDTKDELSVAERRIDAARKELKRAERELKDVPSQPPLASTDSLDEVEHAAKDAKAYERKAERFLKSYGRFVAYDAKEVDLARRTWGERPIDNLTGDESLETYRSIIDGERRYQEGLRQDYLDLEPHPDAEHLYEIDLETVTVTVDYYDDVISGLDNLSLAQLDQADADFLAAAKRLRGSYQDAFFEFAANSGIQKDSRKLGKQGDRLEEEIAALGTGDGFPIRGDIVRDPPPPTPKPRKPSEKSEQSKA